MFPTWLWKAELRPEVYGPINNRVLQSLGEIEAALSDLKPGESWQSEQTLHELETFRHLVACINEAARNVLDHLKVGYEGFAITGCWATVNGPNAGHAAHSHPNNYLSGVYYVQVQEGADTIDFHDPRPQIGILCPPVTELTAENADQVVVKVQEGTMLMFPAWLSHSIEPNRSVRCGKAVGGGLPVENIMGLLLPLRRFRRQRRNKPEVIARTRPARLKAT